MSEPRSKSGEFHKRAKTSRGSSEEEKLLRITESGEARGEGRYKCESRISCTEEEVGVRRAKLGSCLTGYIASWTIQGMRKSLYFSIKEYGEELSKQLAILARKQAVKHCRHPTREQIIALYESLKSKAGANGTVAPGMNDEWADEEFSDTGRKGEGASNAAVLQWDSSSDSWIVEWMTNGDEYILADTIYLIYVAVTLSGRRFRKAFPVSECGVIEGKREAIKFQHHCVKHQTNVVGVAFDRSR